MENSEKNAGGPQGPKGFEALLKQNEIAEAKKESGEKTDSIEERIIKTAPKSGIVRNIRTLKGDIEEGVTRGNTTLSSLARRAGEGKSILAVSDESQDRGNIKKISAYVLGFLLLGGGAFGIFHAYVLREEASVVKVEREDALLLAEKIVTIDATNLSPEEIRQRLVSIRDEGGASLGSVVEARLVKTVVVPEGEPKTLPLIAEEFFTSLKMNAPSQLVRSFQPNFFFGIHIFNGNQPFMIFKTDLYETSFAGMLEWESGMRKSLSGLFRPESDFARISTTSPILPTIFSDVIFKNIDGRALKNENGKILLVYAFPTRDTVIISTNTETVGEIMNLLTSRRVVR